MAQLGRFDDEQMKFIQDVLDEHGDYLEEILQEAIEEKKILRTGDLEGSVKAENGMSGNNPHLEVRFSSYGRAVEIQYHRKSRNSQQFMIADTKKLLYGIRSNSDQMKRRKKKDTRWYAKNVYGSLNTLIGKLMYEYQDWALAREKAIFRMLNKNQKI